MTIIPMRDLKDTVAIEKHCMEEKGPVFVTKNGYGDMVVMSMAAYEQQLARVDMYSKIMEGKAQADKGELLNGPASIAQLREKYTK